MSGEPDNGIVPQVLDALHLIIDPEIGYNIVDLGLVYDIAVTDDGGVCVTMTTTTRGCPATDYLKNGAYNAAGSVDGVKFVDVRLTYDPPWTPRMMSPQAKEYLGVAD